jgi:hypothetical protein
MFFRPLAIIAAIFTVAVVIPGSALSADNKSNQASIAGTVIGPNGKPLGDAEIRAMRVDDPKKVVVITTTNSRGMYMFKGLPAGAYSITAYMDTLAMSRANVKTQGVAYAKVDFDLRLDSGDPMDRMQADFKGQTKFNGNPH